jgi:hypothetical protein
MLARDYPIATELTQQVIERRRLLGELAPCLFDPRYLRGDRQPSLCVVRPTFEEHGVQQLNSGKAKAHRHEHN